MTLPCGWNNAEAQVREVLKEVTSKKMPASLQVIDPTDEGFMQARTKPVSSTYLAMGFANVRAGTRIR